MADIDADVIDEMLLNIRGKVFERDIDDSRNKITLKEKYATRDGKW
jgi:hypothetical protein